MNPILASAFFEVAQFHGCFIKEYKFGKLATDLEIIITRFIIDSFVYEKAEAEKNIKASMDEIIEVLEQDSKRLLIDDSKRWKYSIMIAANTGLRCSECQVP